MIGISGNLQAAFGYPVGYRYVDLNVPRSLESFHSAMITRIIPFLGFRSFCVRGAFVTSLIIQSLFSLGGVWSRTMLGLD